MVIEIYIDTKELTSGQSLVIVDDHGKRWDVEDSLRQSIYTNSRGGQQAPSTRVVLERWRIQLSKPTKPMPKDLGTLLPRIYKNSIVLFRSLYTYAKLLPAWKLKRLSKPRAAHAVPTLKCSITESTPPNHGSGVDELAISLFDTRGRVTEDYCFGFIDSPAGELKISVSYRANCDFRIDNSEALLSSHFMGMDEEMFEPSLGHQTSIRGIQKPVESTTRPTDIGSLPHTRKGLGLLADQGQAYGSLSSFHNMGPQSSSSPISALRTARDMSEQSPSDSPPLKAPPDHRSVQGSRSSLRSADGLPAMARRTSVSFMPFKTPSLSASPLQNEPPITSSPRGSVGRTSALSALAEARTPSSLNPNATRPSSRGSPVLTEIPPTSSVSTSPRPGPTTRYSSSFGHRRARLSVGGGSRTDDDNNSSGKASVTSSTAQPGSGLLPEGGGQSSDSIHTDDDNISEFLKMLDQKKDLKSFRTSGDGASADASTRRTTAALNKFQRMRDSNAALSESMSSSLLLHRSSSSSSRQLSSVPPMVAGTSMSISSSPGKPISPHTPHTPNIPSRLSANSIAENNNRERIAGRHRLSDGGALQENADDEEMARDEGTGAIDIPTSPRPYHPSYRRSSSVAQQHRPLAIDDDLGDVLPFGMRSASVGDGEERPHLSLSALLGLQEASDVAAPVISRHEGCFDPTPDPSNEASTMVRQCSSSQEGREDERPVSARGFSYRPRIGGGRRGQTPPQGSSGSLGGGSGSGSSDQRGGRYNFGRPPSNVDEEEPFLFAMSDLGTGPQSRRSIEESRGGGDSGSSLRRGGKRGGGQTWTG